MKVTAIAATFLATTTLAFPFLGNNNNNNNNNNEARDVAEHNEESGFLGIHWPNFWPKPPGHTPYPYPYYPTPTPRRPTPTPRYPGWYPTPTPTRRYPGWYPVPTPTPTPGGGPRRPWYNPDRTIYWQFKDVKGKTHFVYCEPGKIIDERRYLDITGGPYICGKKSTKSN